MVDVKIFAIGDLHLSKVVNKPMDIFGDRWLEHDKKIMKAWNDRVSDNDWVVVPGDISWAMTECEVAPDLKFVNELRGSKILMKGNHEYWWNSLSKINRIKQENSFNSIYFLQNSAIDINGTVVCGSRGWKCPGENDFSSEDDKIYKRELLRLQMSLDAATKMSGKEIVCFMHFPPFNSKREKSGFTDIMENYGIKRCFYGHIHGASGGVFDLAEDIVPHFESGGVSYRLVSADYICFSPVRIV